MSEPSPRRLEELLQETLANAVKAPYYRRRFGDIWRQVKRLADLPKLPTLDKATAVRHQRALVVGKAPPGIGVVSSGTTRGERYLEPLNVLQGEQEKAAHWEGLPDSEYVPDPYPGWALSVVTVHHGLPHELPGPDELRVPWLHDLNSLAMIEAVLRRPQPDGRRVTVLRMGAGPLKTFTAWLEQRGQDPSRFGVKLIATSSFRLSGHWRALVERRFKAEVFDNYSLSEFSTPVTECPTCGYLHFGWPPLVHELLDLETGAPTLKGPGRLVLTGLYPYVQTMPLIRYDTGDVAVRGPLCRATGQKGIWVLGRLAHGLVINARASRHFVLAPTAVRDVLEGLPHTERNPHPLVSLGVVRSVDLGAPRWSVASSRGGVRLSFEVRFDPGVFEEEARALEKTVRQEVLVRDHTLRKLVRTGALQFQTLAAAPRSLKALVERYD